MATKKQLEALDRGRSLGGLAVKAKQPPEKCPLCKRNMSGRTWHSYLGHLSVHKFASNRGLSFADGYQELNRLALFAIDPVPANGAWARGFKPYLEDEHE